MDSENNEKDHLERNRSPNANMKNGSNHSSHTEDDSNSTSGPTVLFLWIWNWFATLPKTVTNLYAELKSGELLSRFSLLDAMLQFIFAVATSCHPQEEPMSGDTDENKPDGSSSNKSKDVKAFGGTGRTLRSRTVETNS